VAARPHRFDGPARPRFPAPGGFFTLGLRSAVIRGFSGRTN
jgi:hypothetical protein